jgi:hypothetical protein
VSNWDADDFNNVLDALEMMAEQHFIDYPDGTLGHAFTSANENAAEVLLKYRPRVWDEAGTYGIRRLP